MGWVVLAIFAFFLVMIFLGQPLATSLGATGVIFGYFFWGPQVFKIVPSSIFGTMMNYILVAIPLFIFMANILNESGVSDGLFNSLYKLMGSRPGGIGIAVIFVCTVFAACTGVIAASIVAMGTLSLPMMLRYGYDKKLSTGLIAAGGSLGILIPPSIMLVVMADQATISVGRLFAASVMPGLLLATLYVIYIVILTSRNPALAPPMAPELLAQLNKKDIYKEALVSLVPPLTLILGVLGAIFTGIATPTEAAAVGATVALILTIAYGQFTWKKLYRAVRQTALTSGMVMVILAFAGVFTASFMAIGGGSFVKDLLLGCGMSKWIIITLMLGIAFILGMFIDWSGIILICFPIFLPIVEALGFEKLWFVALFAVLLQTSFLTPPFGYALFFLKGIAPPGVELVDIYRGVIPFIGLMVVGTLVCIFVPDIIMYLPQFVH